MKIKIVLEHDNEKITPLSLSNAIIDYIEKCNQVSDYIQSQELLIADTAVIARALSMEANRRQILVDIANKYLEENDE